MTIKLDNLQKAAKSAIWIGPAIVSLISTLLLISFYALQLPLALTIALMLVADEVRKLATMSGETGKNIIEQAEAINDRLNSALHTTEESTHREPQLVSDAQQIIARVIDRYRHTSETLADSSKELWEINSRTKSDIDEMLVALQFQDRVGQVLGNLRANRSMAKFDPDELALAILKRFEELDDETLTATNSDTSHAFTERRSASRPWANQTS